MFSRSKVIGAALALTLLAGTAWADGAGSVFGAMKTARAMGQGRTDATVGVGLADATSFFGTIAYGMGKYTDGRLKLALVDDEGTDGVHLGLGGDMTWQFWSVDQSGRYPIDMGIGGLF